MAVSVKEYDPAKVQLLLAGLIISGFEPGTFLEFDSDAPWWREDHGVDGESIRWRDENPFYTLTVTLRQSASANQLLSNLLNADKISQSVVFPLAITDSNTQVALGAGNLLSSGPPTILLAGRAWIKTAPKWEYSDRSSPKRWVLKVLNVVQNTGGIPTLGPSSLPS